MKTESECRVCLTKDAQKLFDWHDTMNQKLTFAQCYEQCTQLAVKDEIIVLPQLLCYLCAKELQRFHGFIEKAKQADLTLRLKLETCKKQNNSDETFEWVGVAVDKKSPETVNKKTAECHIQLKPEGASDSAAEEGTAEASDHEEESSVEQSETSDYEEKVELNECESSNHETGKLALEQCDQAQLERTASRLGNVDAAETCERSALGTKKRRGRPPKTAHAPASFESNNNLIDDLQALSGRKRRGRPPKPVNVPEGPADTMGKLVEQSKEHVVCEYCSEVYPEKQLKRHIMRKHISQRLLCHACPRTFSDARSLYNHTLTHEENRERKYTCEQCTRKFYTERAYNNHRKTHDSNRKLYQCNQCEKSFFHKGSLKLHQLIHNGKTVDCTICQKRYLRRVDLEIHLRSHSGHTPYQCPYCEKAFTQASVLNKHVRVHQGIRYKCDICGKDYTHQSTMIQHRKEHTGMPLKCAICDKGFVKKSKMRRHIAGVHKVQEAAEVDALIVRVKTLKTYRGRMLEDY